jgi:hypothetical protein
MGRFARVQLKGEVKRWSFRNPHAIVDVKSAKGEMERWNSETWAPSALRRAGWSQESMKAGEFVTLDGVPARDGVETDAHHRCYDGGWHQSGYSWRD